MGVSTNSRQYQCDTLWPQPRLQSSRVPGFLPGGAAAPGGGRYPLARGLSSLPLNLMPPALAHACCARCALSSSPPPVTACSIPSRARSYRRAALSSVLWITSATVAAISSGFVPLALASSTACSSLDTSLRNARASFIAEAISAACRCSSVAKRAVSETLVRTSRSSSFIFSLSSRSSWDLARISSVSASSDFICAFRSFLSMLAVRASIRASASSDLVDSSCACIFSTFHVCPCCSLSTLACRAALEPTASLVESSSVRTAASATASSSRTACSSEASCTFVCLSSATSVSTCVLCSSSSSASLCASLSSRRREASTTAASADAATSCSFSLESVSWAASLSASWAETASSCDS
mmetsp:Transcript_36562/g.77997  ORF Transcript_36562/g.77997 Transcript_36562/m.77997 type:complete len:356 (-) Transcript_36562:2181-3248(-)